MIYFNELLLQQISSKISPQGCNLKAGSDAQLGGLAAANHLECDRESSG
jgi:hypothetical protein